MSKTIEELKREQAMMQSDVRQFSANILEIDTSVDDELADLRMRYEELRASFAEAQKDIDILSERLVKAEELLQISGLHTSPTSYKDAMTEIKYGPFPIHNAYQDYAPDDLVNAIIECGKQIDELNKTLSPDRVIQIDPSHPLYLSVWNASDHESDNFRPLSEKEDEK